MKVYCVEWKSSEQTEQTRAWFGNRKSAEKCARAKLCNGGVANISLCEVPTARVALIEWLNDYLWQNPDWKVK
jgi:hypothetical protein